MVTTADIVSRWRPLSTLETTVAETLLADAELIVNARYPTLEDALDDTVDATLYEAVIVAMVVRVLRNPDGLKRESAGDWSGEYDRASLFLDDNEADLLTSALGLGSTGAFTITPYYVDDSTATIEL